MQNARCMVKMPNFYLLRGWGGGGGGEGEAKGNVGLPLGI